MCLCHRQDMLSLLSVLTAELDTTVMREHKRVISSFYLHRKSRQSLTHIRVPPPLSLTRQGPTNWVATMALLSATSPPGRTMCSALCILIVLLPRPKADNLNNTNQHNGGGAQCGEYTNQVITINTLNTWQRHVV